MLYVENVKKDFLKFQVENRRKLHQIGTLPSVIHEIPLLINNDGTIRVIRQENKIIIYKKSTNDYAITYDLAIAKVSWFLKERKVEYDF